jgi:hypothetical protein
MTTVGQRLIVTDLYQEIGDVSRNRILSKRHVYSCRMDQRVPTLWNFIMTNLSQHTLHSLTAFAKYILHPQLAIAQKIATTMFLSQ